MKRYNKRIVIDIASGKVLHRLSVPYSGRWAMAATTRSSTLYTNYDTNKYPADARDRWGRVVPVYFEITIVSTAAAADVYHLFKLPAGWSVAFLHATSNGLGASAGTGVTVEIGDSGDTDRLMVATDMDLAAGIGHLRYEGVGYRPTTDTVVDAKIGSVAAVVGKIIKGHALLIPGS